MSTDAAKTAILNTEKLVAEYMKKDTTMSSSGLMGQKTQGARPMQQGDKRLLTARETVAKAVAEIRKMRQGLKNG